MFDSTSKPLPYLNILLNPNRAFRQLAEDPPTKETLALALVTSLVVAFLVVADFITPPQKHSFAACVRLLWHATHVSVSVARFYSLLTIPLILAAGTFTCLIFYVIASLLGAELSFSAFWTGYFFIQSMFLIPTYLTEGHVWVHAGLILWQTVLCIGMIRILCGFTVRRAVATFFAPTIALLGLLAIVALFIFSLKMFPGRLTDQFLRAPTLTPVRIPMDYSWAAQTLDGSGYKMDTLRGKVVVLNFWATWCGPCQMEMPSLQKLYDAVKDQNIVVIAMSEEKLPDVQRFLKKKNYTFPIMVRYERMPLFSSTAIPATFVISADGQIVGRQYGAAKWEAPSFIKYLISLKTRTPPETGNSDMNLGMDPRSTARILNNQAVKLVDRRQYTQAEDYYERALRVLQPDAKPQDANLLACLIEGQGYIAYKLGRYEEADILMKKALHLEKAAPQRDEKQIAETLLNLKSLHFAMKRRSRVAI